MANGDITLAIKVSGTTTNGDSIRTFYETKTVSSVSDVFDRTLSVPTTEATILQVGTVAGATLAALNGIVVHNTDSTNFLTLGIKDAGSKSIYFKIPAGEMFVLMEDQVDCDDDTGAAFAAFSSADTVTLKADTAAVIAQVVAF